MTSKEIRQQFLDFFASKDHTIVDSSPVVPLDDPTLMFTNAGMNQFKDVFLGTGSRSFKRAADTQKCIRAGGKHNDLDDVGQDTYHHTFFEMLGNWSFGDYFKKEAIEWAWELMTGVWGIEKDRLHATYFEGDQAEGLEPDSEAAELWRTVTDINPDHIHPGNKKDNFWEMGDTGPCGPCSEIHIDLTPDKSGKPLVNAGDERVIELWNLVFIQFNRANDGELSTLPAQHVDTGMGFERICAVLQGMHSARLGEVTNYDTDVFTPLFDAIRDVSGANPYSGTLPGNENITPGVTSDQVLVDVSYRVIADHLRCLTFAIADGAVPSNEGRGYVLRRILRRAVRYGRQYLGLQEPFLYRLLPTVVNVMAGAFPDLRRNPGPILEIVRSEETSFAKTLDRGIALFEEAAGHATRHHHGRITGEDAFKLHDTYGFPIDLTELMAEEAGLKVDIGEYERLMEVARERARSSGKSAEVVVDASVAWGDSVPSTNDGPKYDGLNSSATVLAVARLTDGGGTVLLADGESLSAGERGIMVTDQTCFYSESGGQVGDTGCLTTDQGRFEVENTLRPGNYVQHIGRQVEGRIGSGQSVSMRVGEHRIPTQRNHTSTHIMNWALREVLGDHIQQKGSLVDPEKTRFDFSHNKPVATEELNRIEQLVNGQIESQYPVYTKEVDQAKAREINTLRAVFGEKYPDVVRVVSIGADIDEMLNDPKNERWMQHSVEFCGGTHVQNSSEAGRFVLTTEEGVAKGVRRVVGISGEAANAAISTGEKLLSDLKSLESCDQESLAASVNQLQQQVNDSVIPIGVREQLRSAIAEMQKKARQLQKQSASESAGAVMEKVAALLQEADTKDGVTIVTGEVPAAGSDALRNAVDWIRNKTETSAVFLATSDGQKVTLIAGMSKVAVTKALKAGDLIKECAPLVGGRGGGRPDMAQGGGTDPSGISEAVDKARSWIAEKLS